MCTIQERNQLQRHAFSAVLASAAADITKAALLCIQRAISSDVQAAQLCRIASHVQPATHQPVAQHQILGCACALPQAIVLEAPSSAVGLLLNAMSDHFKQGLGFKHAGKGATLRVYAQAGQCLHPLLCQQVQMACHTGSG